MARSSLSPIALPADPASALHAAPKQYCDHLDPVDLVGADGAFARYTSSVAQSCGSGTDTWVAYPDAEVSNGIVTQGTLTPGHKFTLNYTGIYTVTIQARFVWGGATGERYFALWSDQNGGDAVMGAYGAYSAATSETTMTVTYTGKFTSGKYVAGRVWQTSSGNMDLTTYWRWIMIALVRKYS